MEKHTVGPWTIHGKKSVLTTEHDIYFEIFGRDYDISEANARLIAAAPDLLHALESITLSMRAHPDCTEGSEFADMVSIANDAISKAKGL